MNNPIRISAVPDGLLFKQVTVSVVQIGHDHIPDFNPDPLDRALVRLQRAMRGRVRRGLDEVRAWLDWPPGVSRRELGLRLPKAEPSDISIAAVLLGSHNCSFGLQYEWPPGASRVWPDGFCLVLWRGDLFERVGDVLTPWTDGGA